MIFRKKPVEGYDLSFLITEQHLQKFDKNLLIDWILDVCHFFVIKNSLWNRWKGI